MGFSMTEVALQRYLFEYRHLGSEWGIEIAATSPEDAKKRLQALAWANYKGRVAATIPLPGKSLSPVITWVKKLLGLPGITSCYGNGVPRRRSARLR